MFCWGSHTVKEFPSHSTASRWTNSHHNYNAARQYNNNSYRLCMGRAKETPDDTAKG